jgi:hypothetical protein
VDGGGPAYCGMVQHGGTADVVDRGCFDLPEIGWICLEVACGCLSFWYILQCHFGLVQPSVLLLLKPYIRHSIDPE